MNGYKHQIKTCVWTRTLQVYWAASGRSSGFRRMATDKKQPKKRSNILLRYYIVYIYIYYINRHTHFFYGLVGSYTDRPSISWYLSSIPDMGQQQMFPAAQDPLPTSAGARSCRDLSATATANSPRQAAFRTSRAIVWACQCTGVWSTILIFLDAKKYWKPWNIHQSYVSGLNDGFLWIFT